MTGSLMQGQRQAPQTYVATMAQANPLQLGIASAATMFTAAPAGGFPELVLNDPEAVFAGLPRDRVQVLRQQCALLLYIHNVLVPRSGDVRPLTNALAALLLQITGESNLVIIPPEAEWSASGPRRGGSGPTTWAVLGMTERGRITVLEYTVWSASMLTIHVFTSEVLLGRYMFTLWGFAHDHGNAVWHAVWNVFSGQYVYPMIVQLVQSNPAHVGMNPDDAANSILASLAVRVSRQNNGNILAAVFCDSPTQSIPRWREWRDTVARMPFPNPVNTTGTVRRAPACAGCQGADHPTHLCPFPDVPGWNAPPPGTHWAQPGAGPSQTNTTPAGPPPLPGPPAPRPRAPPRPQYGRRDGPSFSDRRGPRDGGFNAA